MKLSLGSMFKTIFIFMVSFSIYVFSQDTPGEIAIESLQKIVPTTDFKVVQDKFEFIEGLCLNSCEDTFHVVDMGVLAERYAFWKKHLPDVTPYYAVNTNNDKVIAAALASLGTGFDISIQKC